MSTKLFLRPHNLQFHLFTTTKTTYPTKLPTLKLSFCTTTLQTPLTSYGPSLHKGTYPSTQTANQNEDNENDNNINKDEFTRVYNISALRVPANYCFALETRLRGHLLNWPRVRNIARVPGDDIDPDINALLGNRKDDTDPGKNTLLIDGKDYINPKKNTLLRNEGDDIDPEMNTILSNGEDDIDPKKNTLLGGGRDGEMNTILGNGAGFGTVLGRDELAREFDTRGYVRFRNLAKMSRPKRKAKEEKGGGIRRNELSVVEVVEDEEEEVDLRGLLGEGFKGGGRKWRGSTRLLLLDERYAERGVEELPEAVKALLKEDTTECGKCTCELVRCKLTLFYDYWQMYEILEAILPTGMVVPSAFETVGHIAHLNLREEHLPYKKVIAKVVLDKNKPKLRTVVNKIDAINNDYRTMELEVLAGNHSLVTTVVESGLRFNFDLATVYWNSRLATERQRLVNGFTRDDVICDVFSGVGPIALCAAKIVKRVYANDLNPHAVEYLEKNSVLNKLERKIQVFNMDGRRFINAMFTSEKAKSITQVIMNLPNDAAEFLDAFRGIFRERPRDTKTKLPKIHVYGFSRAEDPEFDFHKRLRIALSEVAVDVEMRRVRVVAPGKWMLCASFILPESVAYGKPLLDL